MELQVGVKVLLKNKIGEFLFIKRADGRQKGMWDIGGGGRMNPGIPLFENLQRELREELGFEIKKQPKLLFAQDIIHDNEKHIVRLTFGSEEVFDISPVLSEEHSEFIWLDKQKALALPGLDPLIKTVLGSL